ncbi:MAG: hypothetical protein ACPGVA_16785 [Pikeienuella sp.]
MPTISGEALRGALEAITHSAGSPRGQIVGFNMEQLDAVRALIKAHLSHDGFYTEQPVCCGGFVPKNGRGQFICEHCLAEHGE